MIKKILLVLVSVIGLCSCSFDDDYIDVEQEVLKLQYEMMNENIKKEQYSYDKTYALLVSSDSL